MELRIGDSLPLYGHGYQDERVNDHESVERRTAIEQVREPRTSQMRSPLERVSLTQSADAVLMCEEAKVVEGPVLTREVVDAGEQVGDVLYEVGA